MYEREALNVWKEPTQEQIDNYTDELKPCDARADEYPSHLPGPIAYLDHSCDQWVIGGRDQVLAMIADLTALLAEMGGEKT
jgi:hypothetical protein